MRTWELLVYQQDFGAGLTSAPNEGLGLSLENQKSKLFFLHVICIRTLQCCCVRGTPGVLRDKLAVDKGHQTACFVITKRMWHVWAQRWSCLKTPLMELDWGTVQRGKRKMHNPDIRQSALKHKENARTRWGGRTTSGSEATRTSWELSQWKRKETSTQNRNAVRLNTTRGPPLHSTKKCLHTNKRLTLLDTFQWSGSWCY